MVEVTVNGVYTQRDRSIVQIVIVFTPRNFRWWQGWRSRDMNGTFRRKGGKIHRRKDHPWDLVETCYVPGSN